MIKKYLEFIKESTQVYKELHLIDFLDELGMEVSDVKYAIFPNKGELDTKTFDMVFSVKRPKEVFVVKIDIKSRKLLQILEKLNYFKNYIIHTYDLDDNDNEKIITFTHKKNNHGLITIPDYLKSKSDINININEVTGYDDMEYILTDYTFTAKISIEDFFGLISSRTLPDYLIENFIEDFDDDLLEEILDKYLPSILRVYDVDNFYELLDHPSYEKIFNIFKKIYDIQSPISIMTYITENIIKYLKMDGLIKDGETNGNMFIFELNPNFLINLNVDSDDIEYDIFNLYFADLNTVDNIINPRKYEFDVNQLPNYKSLIDKVIKKEI